MPKKILVIVLVIGISIGLIIGLFLPQILSATSQINEISNPKIACLAIQSQNSDWYTAEGNPVFASYQAGTPNYTVTSINFGVLITNNNTKSLFNIQVEVSYKTTQGDWTTVKENKGFIDMNEAKQTTVNLPNPYLSLWDTKRPIYGNSETQWEYVTVYYLDASYYRIIAYGYSEP
jgi:hypothetical protein